MQNDKARVKNEFKQRLYRFVLELIACIDQLPNDAVSRRIGDQLLRSGTSILANYIEAQAASSKRDFINFFTHSLKSTNESKLWVALLRDTKRIKRAEAARLLKELDELANIFAASILTAKGKRRF